MSVTHRCALERALAEQALNGFDANASTHLLLSGRCVNGLAQEVGKLGAASLESNGVDIGNIVCQ